MSACVVRSLDSMAEPIQNSEYFMFLTISHAGKVF